MQKIMTGVFLCSILALSSFGLAHADSTNQTDTSKQEYQAMIQKLHGQDIVKMQAESLKKIQDEIKQQQMTAYKKNYVVTDQKAFAQWKSSWITIANSKSNNVFENQNGLAMQKHLQTLQLLKQYEEYRKAK